MTIILELTCPYKTYLPFGFTFLFGFLMDDKFGMSSAFSSSEK